MDLAQQSRKLKRSDDKNDIKNIKNEEPYRVSYSKIMSSDKTYQNFRRVLVDELNTEYVECIKCGSIVRYVPREGNSSVRRHGCVNTPNSKRESTVTPISNTITTMVESSYVKKPTKQNKSLCIEKFVDFLTSSNNEFDILRDDSFIRLVQYLLNLGASINGTINAKELVPDVKTISNKIDERYEERLIILKSILKPIKTASIVFDHWNSRYFNKKFIGISIRYLYDGEMQSNLLWFKVISDVKSTSIIGIFEKCLKRFELQNKDLNVVTNNTKNIICTFKKVEWFNCSADQLQKVINDMFVLIQNEFNTQSKYEDIVNLISNVRSLVTYVNGKKKKLQIDLKDENELRFDSKFFMIDSVLKKWKQMNEMDDYKLKDLISKIDYGLLKSIHEFLEFTYNIRLMICEKDKCTINLILPTYQRIVDYMRDESDEEDIRIRVMKCYYLKFFKDHFKITEIHKIATFLTPMFKDFHELLNEDDKLSVHADLEKRLSNFEQLEEEIFESEKDDFFASFISTKVSKISEVEQYINYTPTIDETSCSPIKFWINHQSSWPKLSKYALSILSIPATSILIEDIFLHCNSSTTNFSNIRPQKANKCTFLKLNFPS